MSTTTNDVNMKPQTVAGRAFLAEFGGQNFDPETPEEVRQWWLKTQKRVAKRIKKIEDEVLAEAGAQVIALRDRVESLVRRCHCGQIAHWEWEDESGQESVCDDHKDEHFYSYGPIPLENELAAERVLADIDVAARQARQHIAEQASDDERRRIFAALREMGVGTLTLTNYLAHENEAALEQQEDER